jgi:hypothetical protein
MQIPRASIILASMQMVMLKVSTRLSQENVNNDPRNSVKELALKLLPRLSSPYLTTHR